jgi:hypothetical protein
MLFFRLCIVCTVVCVIFTSCNKLDVSGRYKAKIIVIGSGMPINNIDFMLIQKGNDISGNMTLNVGPVGQFNLTGTLNGNKLSFNTESKNGFNISFIGKAEGNTIKGDADLINQGPRIGTKQDKATFEMVKQ